MSRETILASARRASESTMSGECTITRSTPDSFDDVSLQMLDTDPSDDVIYEEGPFRMKSPSSAVVALNTEGELLSAQQMVLCLPIVSGPFRRDDLVTIIDGGLEPGLTGRTFRVAGLFAQSWATEQRLPVEGLS
jgi:hypothetical protein